ncbi:ALK and LTK ligand 1 [Egretta garzetta]|nr:ALK and LTK ligand 1 [Egretta garzetta]
MLLETVQTQGKNQHLLSQLCNLNRQNAERPKAQKGEKPDPSRHLGIYYIDTFFFLFSSEIFPRDSSLKDKFIKHFTGPVTFSSECSKHFHRLYHNTRDCSTPAYYKRCARLLTRLAMSPLCTQS